MISRTRKFKFLIGHLAVACALIYPSFSSADPWNTHKTSLAGRQTKMGALESEIQALIHEKGHTDQPAELRHITQTMEEKHKALKTLATEQREEQLHVRFRHPEKGDESAREYMRYKFKSLNEMESEFGLDAKLDRIQEKVRLTYGIRAIDPKVAEEAQRNSHSDRDQKRLPASEANGDPERIVLKK